MKNKISSSSISNFERPLVTVDVVIFTVISDALHVLLVQRAKLDKDPAPGRWALPGGFIDVQRDKTLEDCARRKLKEKTGVKTPYLEQLGSWGSAARDPRGWSATHAYFALIHLAEDSSNLGADSATESTTNSALWVPIDDALSRKLAFDHTNILQTAVQRLRGKVEYTSLPAYLLKEPFTLPELQHCYEVILARPMDKSAFRKRMLDAGFLEDVGSVESVSGRHAVGYRIKNKPDATVFPRTFKAKEEGA